MKTKIISTITAILLCVVCVNVIQNLSRAFAQDKPAVASAPTPASPLALTDTEKADLANLNARFIQADQILTARLRVVLEVECESCDQDFAVKLGIDDARKFYREQVKAAQAAYLKRLEEVQQAHDCLGCAIKDGAFVKAAKN